MKWIPMIDSSLNLILLRVIELVIRMPDDVEKAVFLQELIEKIQELREGVQIGANLAVLSTLKEDFTDLGTIQEEKARRNT